MRIPEPNKKLIPKTTYLAEITPAVERSRKQRGDVCPFPEVAQNLKDKPVTPLSGDLAELGTIMTERLRRDFECVGLDYNAFYPGEVRLEALENLLNATEQPREDQVFFYHSDHLGSSSFITDVNGDATQHLQYLPFGEDFVHQQNTAAYYTPYTFSGKERDLETNLSYFGARYYEAGLSVWLSVDPMSEARPYLSPYNYCQLNPIMLVDPTGMLDESPGDLVGEATSKDGGSDNLWKRHLSQMPTPGPKGLPATMRPSSAQFHNNPMIAGNGGDDPPKKKGPSIERQLLYGMPVIGPTQESSDRLSQGDYIGSIESLGWAFLDLILLGQGSSARSWLSTSLRTGFCSSNLVIHFGQNADQVRHAFRHVEALGLDPKVVQAAVEAHFRPLAPQVVNGIPFNRTIIVQGQKIQYTAWRLKDGIYNIGRIHGAK